MSIARRNFFRKLGGYSLLGYAASRQLAASALAASGGHSFRDNVFTRLGVRPFISANIPFTFLSATVAWPEVRKAADEAAHYFVNIVDLQKAAGRRLAQISGAESGMITSGAAGANAVATAACIAGTDPAKIWQLPDTSGLKHEVIMWGGRNVFDSAVRLAGGKPVAVHTLDELRGAIGARTAMIHTHYPADPDPTDPPPLADMIRIAKSAGIPIFVDAAGGVPPIENLKRYSAMGADLYAFSGGKGLRGPQASGLLLGRQDLIEAALANSNPVEGAVCRAMKVGKEEIAGCMAAVEKWLTVDLETLYAEQRRKLARIAAMVETVKGVTTVTDIRRGSNRFAQLTLRWDPAALGIGAEECARRLREGEPSISVLSNYNPYVIRYQDPAREGKAEPPRDDQIVVFSLGLQPGEELIVGRRLREVLKGR